MSDDRVKRTQEITRLRVSRFQKLRKGAAGDRLHECELSIRDEVIENDEEGINKYFNWINTIDLYTFATTYEFADLF